MVVVPVVVVLVVVVVVVFLSLSLGCPSDGTHDKGAPAACPRRLSRTSLPIIDRIVVLLASRRLGVQLERQDGQQGSPK